MAADAESFPHPLPPHRQELQSAPWTDKNGTAEQLGANEEHTQPQQAAPGLTAKPLSYPSRELLILLRFKCNWSRERKGCNYISTGEPCGGEALECPQDSYKGAVEPLVPN